MTAIVEDGLASWWVRPLWTRMGGHAFGSVVSDGGAVRALRVSLADLSHEAFTLGTHEEDDHNAAAHVVPGDHPPIYFWARHGQDTSLRYRIGSGGPGVLAFGSEQTITFAGTVTYAQAWRRPGTDEVHVLVRDASRYWSSVYSSGWGTGWSSPRRVFDGGAGGDDLYYIATQAVEGDPSIVRVAVYGHPHLTDVHDIRAGLIDLVSGDIMTLDETVLGNLRSGDGLPIPIGDLDLAVETEAGHTVRMYDVSGGAKFAIAYSDWEIGEDDDSMYRVATLDGAWSSEDVVASGPPFGAVGIGNYFGGIAFGNGGLWLSRKVGETWHVERWVKRGAWTLSRPLAQDSVRIVRPWAVAGGGSLPVVWHRVTSYTDVTWVFSSSVEAAPRPSSLRGVQSAWPSMQPGA